MRTRPTKILLSLAAVILYAANLHATDLKLNERDVNKVELELKPKSPVTTLRIHSPISPHRASRRSLIKT
jgi:hypothetical protein